MASSINNSSCSVVEAEEAERARRLVEDKASSVINDESLCDELLEKANEVERKVSQRVAIKLSEDAREEKIADEMAREKAGEEERAKNQKLVDEAVERERQERLREYGEEVRPTSLSDVMEDLKPEMERRANSIHVKNLADQEQRDRVLEAIERELKGEAERLRNRELAVSAMEEERQERVSQHGASARHISFADKLPEIAEGLEKTSTTITVKKLADAEQSERVAAAIEQALRLEAERNENRRSAVAAMEAERQERIAANAKAETHAELASKHNRRESIIAEENERARRLVEEQGEHSHLVQDEILYDELLEKANEVERKVSQRVAIKLSEDAREERIADEMALEKAGEEERAKNQKLADEAVERERQERLHEYGEEVRPTSLSDVMEDLKPEMERRANSIVIKNIANDEQRSRILRAIEREFTDERVHNRDVAIVALEHEREERVRAEAARDEEAERDRRVLEEIQHPPPIPQDQLVEACSQMERKANRRFAAVASEQARKEQMEDLAAIDKAEEEARKENRSAALDAMEAERLERLKEYGKAPRPTSLASRMPEIAHALEQKTMHVHNIGDADQAERVAVAIQAVLDQENKSNGPEQPKLAQDVAQDVVQDVAVSKAAPVADPHATAEKKKAHHSSPFSKHVKHAGCVIA